MAELALDLLDAGVYIMAEGNRLFRAEAAQGRLPVDIDEGCHSQYGDQRKENSYIIFFQHPIPCQ